ncbi:MAG: hypothetical protein KDA80_19580 [Planctomycetaceae bacterium]|nr:hypothetical protein [Planctomycetaceae bacterium]
MDSVERLANAIELLLIEQRETNRLLRQITRQGDGCDGEEDKVTRAMILLTRYDGSKSKIAESVGVSPTTMWRSKDWAPFRVAYARYKGKKPRLGDIEIVETETRHGIIDGGRVNASVETDWDSIDGRLDRSA